jgi:DNA polymerase/3'-5' exonuclease PolX
MKELTNFMGIGEERAKDLISAGLKHVNQLRMKKYYNLLPEETKIFITLKPLNQIPNEHIKILEPYLMKASDKNLALTIVGSYRRQKPFSSDIDVMVVSDNTDAIDLLHSRLDKILNGKIYPYSKGADKMSFIVDMSELVGEKNKIYKIDAFRTLPENAVPMLLYSTGSKEFNIIMRSRAKKQGYLLNQKGLFKDDKLVEGLNDEKAYFDILKMDYKEPKEISKISGIPKNWNKSNYNKKKEATQAFDGLIKDTKAKIILVSYNDEGILSLEELKNIFEKYGTVTLKEKTYSTFKASRNLMDRSKIVKENLFMIQKG